MSYYIGIDAGACTGLAEWQYGGDLRCDTTTFWGAIDRIREMHKCWGTHLCVVIEAGWKNRPVFARPGVQGRRQLRIAQNVGQNHAHGKLIVDYCDLKGIRYLALRPGTPKLNDEQFRRLTGYDGTTSQHARDAAMMVWGRQ
jgi:hypothetical protein